MLDIEYGKPPVEVKLPLKSVHLQTHNNAHFHAEAAWPSLFHVAMSEDDVAAGKAFYFTAAACDEAIEFFTLLRDELNKKKDA